jgi:hypothetical protein
VDQSARATSAIDEARERMRNGEFAFVDGGCGVGGSIDYCERIFKLGRGIGFDSSPQKVAAAVAAGRVAYEADVRTIELPARSVAFATFLDFLEHLPDVGTTRAVLENLVPVARDFFFIRHPNFDEIDYLRTLGLKLDWTDWRGHRNKMPLAELVGLITSLGLPRPVVFGQKPIADSMHPAMVPLDAPLDTVGYDANVHGPKALVRFERPIYAQFDVFVRLDAALPELDWIRISNSVIHPRNATVQLREADFDRRESRVEPA